MVVDNQPFINPINPYQLIKMSQPAATIGSMHVCPMSDGPKPHVGGPAIQGSPTVFIGGKASLRQGDLCQCNSPAPDAVAQGSATVFINGAPAARQGDLTAHGGSMAEGVPTVFIG